jgi:hypothetical protein
VEGVSNFLGWVMLIAFLVVGVVVVAYSLAHWLLVLVS